MKRSNSANRLRQIEQLEPRVVLDGRGVIINEFMAANQGSLRDEDDQSSDWIEIYNDSDVEVDLEGWRLTDNALASEKWVFPSQQLAAGEYLVVFASGKDRADAASELHTSFKLRSAGEYLALIDSADAVRSSFVPRFPAQLPDVSYGLSTDGVLRFFAKPTPGAANGEGVLFAKGVTLSHASGFYDEALELSLSTNEESATIRYTTNGAQPSADVGTDYEEPLSISQSTVIRAAVFRDGFEPSKIETRSFLFLDDVLGMSDRDARKRGFPSKWGERDASYEVDARVVGPDGTDRFDGVYADTVRDDLLSIASLSLVVDQEEFFGANGIYSKPDARGPAFEKAVNGELIDPESGSKVQFDAGVRIQGGISRVVSKKNSLRLAFRSEYGASTLQYPLFGDDAAGEFNSIALRSSGGEVFNGRHYIKDPFVRRSQQATGNAASHGRFLHVYINGLYWGVYEAVERPDAQFMSSYYGGDKDDWDVINAGDLGAEADSAIDGNTRAWRKLIQVTKDIRRSNDSAEQESLFLSLQGKNPDGTRNPDLDVLLDVDNYIDYLFTNWHASNTDWPHRNYYMGRDRSEQSTGFKFVSWDSEFTLEDVSACTQANSFREGRGPAAIFQGLFETEGFRVRMADRAQILFSSGGAFYVNEESRDFASERPEDNVPAARYQELVDEFVRPLVPESARWSEVRFFGGGDILTRDEIWLPKVEEHLEFMAKRDSRFSSCLSRSKIIRTAPTFDVEHNVLPSGGAVSLSSDSDDIYYTQDGSDPRNEDGSISDSAILFDTPIRITQPTVVSVRSLEDGKWSAIDAKTFLVDGQADATSLRLSEVHYHPADADEAERDLGFQDANEFEFVELVNTSEETIDLTTAQLVRTTRLLRDDGVAFRFADSEVSVLAPGASVVVVENVAAFQARYGDDVLVAGAWQGKLDNDKESIRLDVGGLTVQEFQYQDNWYAETDGEGLSLEVVDANAADLQNWNRQLGWQPSAVAGGTPGQQLSLTPADFNSDGQVTSADIDLLYAAIAADSKRAVFDLNEDGHVDRQDIDFLLGESILNTRRGDLDLNGKVDYADFLALSANFGKTGGWATGDVNGDAEVGFADFLILSREFGLDVG